MLKNEASSYEGEASLCYTRLLKSVDKITNLQNNHTLDLLNSDKFFKNSVDSDVGSAHLQFSILINLSDI